MRLAYEQYHAPHSITIQVPTTAKKRTRGGRSVAHTPGAWRSAATAASTMRFMA